MALVEWDNDFLEVFYNITNSKVPKDVQLVDLKKQLIEIVETLKDLNRNSKKPIISKALGNDEPEEDSKVLPLLNS